METCFGCKHLKITETLNMMVALFDCKKQTKSANTIGWIGGKDLIYVPPERMNANCFEYYLD